MANPYSYLTLAQLQTALLNRLGDPSGTYWVTAEINLYITEALRTWNCMTQCWRDRMTFPASSTAPGNPWYDLTQQAGSLIPYTVTDAILLSEILYHVLEPQVSGGNYVGTDMFLADDFTKALERRRNQFLLETGMVLQASIINAGSPPIAKVTFGDTVIDIRRLAFIDSNSVYTTLWRTDEWRASAFSRGWENNPSNPPQAYATSSVPPLNVRIVPPSSVGGRLDIVYTPTGSTLAPFGSGVALGIPDDFTWVVKWGALADLLGKTGQSMDRKRADYCEARFKEGIAIARQFNSVVGAYINGVFKYPSTVKALDSYRQNWQNVSGAPDVVAVMGWNLIALSNVPDSAGYGIMLDVVENAPVPQLSTDLIQMSREELDSALGYMQHLAAFKQAGEEFDQTIPLYQNFVQLAMTRNERLRAAIPSLSPIKDVAAKEESVNARRTAEPQAVGG